MANQAHILITTLAADGHTASKPTLQLSGRAMPYQGFELEGTMTAEFTWYPGNPVASAQMLGSKEKATTLKGMWKDKFIRSVTDENIAVEPQAVALFDRQQVVSVIDLCAKVDKIRLAGQPVRVEWGELVRVGILIRFKQNWIRFEDVEWEMEFQWTSRGGKQKPVTIPHVVTASSFAKDLQTFSDNLFVALKPPAEFQAADAFVAQLDAAAADIEDAVGAVANSVANTVSLVSVVDDASARALASAESVKNAAGSIMTTVESFPPLDVIKSATPEDLTLGDALQADNYSRGIKTAARALQAFASSSGDDLRASLDKDTLLAAFVARGPMDLRDVSQRYYSTPNEWRRLLTYNALDSSRLVAGDLVLVPKIVDASSRA